MVCCIAFGCKNKDVDISRGVSFFTLPHKRPEILKLWLAELRLKEPPVSKNSRVCSEHFDPQCFQRDLKSELLGTKPVRRLKPCSIPTIFTFTLSMPKRTNNWKRVHAADENLLATSSKEMKIESSESDEKNELRTGVLNRTEAQRVVTFKYMAPARHLRKGKIEDVVQKIKQQKNGS